MAHRHRPDPLGWLWRRFDGPTLTGRAVVPPCDLCPAEAVDHDPRTGATRCADHLTTGQPAPSNVVKMAAHRRPRRMGGLP